MRFHRNYDEIQLWKSAVRLREFARPQNLVAARFEPVIRQGLPHSIVDLVFRAGERYVTVPAVIVDSPQVVLREQDRFVWPAFFAGAMEDAQALDIEEFLFPWLRSLSLAHSLTTERIRHFGTPQDRARFESARACRFVGAALLEHSINALAPYVYGARYAFGKRAAVVGANDGAQGAVYLSRVAQSVSVSELDHGQVEMAAHWFEYPPPVNEGVAHDVIFTGERVTTQTSRVRDAVTVTVDATGADPACRRIVAAAYPLDLMFTWATLHGPPAREFAVDVPEVPIPARASAAAEHKPAGGSGGRVILGVRRDWQTASDSDSDVALRLAEHLRGEGFTVDLTGEPSACDFASYDVAHCFNLIEAPMAVNFLAHAKRAGIRTVLTAMFTDISGEKRQWGTETAQVAFKQEFDEASIRSYLGFMGRRALLAPHWDDENARRGPIPNYDEIVSQALGLCDCVIAESNAESDLLRSFGYRGDLRIVAPFLPALPAQSVAPPVGFARFALIHAPIEPRHNQLYAVRGARAAGIPLVLAGYARDMDYAARIREAGDESVVMIDPAATELAWLYASADVIADASWYGFGTERLWRAILSGARVAASSSGWAGPIFGELATLIDPADPQSIADGLLAAAAVPSTVRSKLALGLNTTALLRNVLAAYTGVPVPVSHA